MLGSNQQTSKASHGAASAANGRGSRMGRFALVAAFVLAVFAADAAVYGHSDNCTPGTPPAPAGLAESAGWLSGAGSSDDIGISRPSAP
mmetsp:Transcript_50760/g.146418  ORF Transcript_50760/g.146418 Transcript_50760/m.146418 type:complete len:89 (-) Transcript_50760:164-430(-)